MNSLLFILLLLALILSACAETAKTDAPKDCLYRSMNPPGKAEPIQDYYNPYHPNTIPEFLTSDRLDYPRIVEFYSPTCPHCQQFASQYVSFAKHFVNLTKDSHYASLMNIQFHAVSCIAHQRVCREELVKNYPTIKIIPANTASKDGVVIKAHELHQFKVAKVLGVETVPWPEDTNAATTKEEKVTTGVVRGSRLRGSQNLVLRKTVKPPAKERVELPTTTVTLARHSTKIDPSFPPRAQKELFNDAYLAFYMTLKNSVFTEPGQLPKHKQDTLKEFLELLQGALPSWRIHSLLDKLLADFSRITFHEKVWSNALEKFPPHTLEFSPACQLHGNGYSCGMWSFFHILTVGVSEYNRVNIVKEEELSTFVTGNVADTLKDFIATFFLCDECTAQFLKDYGNCAFDRCKLLANDRTNYFSATLTEWSQLPLWLLRTHNAINVRLQGQRSKHRALTVEEQQKVMWPPIEDCPACWLEANGATSKFNETVLYKYLRVTYWPEDAETQILRKEIAGSSVSFATPTKAAYTADGPTKKPIARTITKEKQPQKQSWTKRAAARVTSEAQPKQRISKTIDEVVSSSLEAESEDSSSSSIPVFFSFIFIAGILAASNKRKLWQRKSWVEHTE